MAKKTAIYNVGRLLSAVQCGRLFEDSKEFVDMPLKCSPATLLSDYAKIGGNGRHRRRLEQFVHSHFAPAGSDLESVTPDDYETTPDILTNISDRRIRDWALHVHQIWPLLYRQVSPDVANEPERHSLLYVPHPFVVPGGRFREMYYWDNYWTIKGLLISNLTETAKHIISNMAYLITSYGFMPNGNRSYYLLRSQPPLFTYCVHDYVNATGDIDTAKQMLPVVEMELSWWLQNRSLTLDDGSIVYQYRSPQTSPRAESYREDVDTCLFNGKDWRNVCLQIASAAESGWDFSTRWIDDSNRDLNLLRTQRARFNVTQILPVDLNALIGGVHRLMSHMYMLVDNVDMQRMHELKYEQSKLVLRKHFWHAEDGMWYDVQLPAQDSNQSNALTHRRSFYASNLMPLFTRCNTGDITELPSIISYLRSHGCLNAQGGLPMSLVQGAGEQWDWPNGFAPLVHIAVHGLCFDNTNAESIDVGHEICRKWLRTNYKTFIRTKQMYEKYDTTSDKFLAGDGGEYPVQLGFGWTNGVMLDLLYNFGHLVRSIPDD